MVAIRNLQRIRRDLDSISTRINTGLKISGPLDDASSFAIAQGLRAEIRAWEAVDQGLGMVEGAVTVAEAGVGAISDLLNDLKAKTIEYFAADTAQQTIIEADINAMLDQIDLMANGAVFGGVNLINTDQDDLIFAPPPDQGTVFSLTGGGNQSNTHVLGTQTGTLQVDYAGSGSGGGQIRLVYDGRTVASASINPPASDTGSLIYSYDLTGPAEFTIQKTGSRNISVDYSFALTPTGLDKVTGDYKMIRSIDGSSLHVQHRSLLSADLGLRPLSLADYDTALGQVDAAIAEVQLDLAYYSGKFREIRLSREMAERFMDAQTEGLGHIVDADLAREAGRFTAAKAREALAIDVLRSTQQSQRAILNLFA